MKKVIDCQVMCSNELVCGFYQCKDSRSFFIEILDHSVQILDLLKNPHLRVMIKSLDRSISPADEMQKAMMEPIFVQFVDELLKVVETNAKL